VKVGILLWELDVLGGTQRQALSLAHELVKLGDDVTVYCYRADVGRCYRDLMRDLRIVALERDLAGAVPVSRLPKFLRRWTDKDEETTLLRAVAASLPTDLDLLNVHDYYVYPAAYYWKKRVGRPVVWMMNDLPWSGGVVAKRRSWGKEIERFINGKMLDEWKHRRLIRTFDSVVVLDHRNERLLSDATGRSAVVIRSGLDLKAFAWVPRDPPRGDRPVQILSNAIFFPYRRLEDIVGALCILRDRGIPFRWTHIGPDSRDPEYAKAIYAAVEQENLSASVCFTGSLTDDELLVHFQSADVFLFPNAPQTWGLAVFQAMACGTPVVVSRGAGASEVLADRENALLVDPFSPPQIAEAVVRLSREPDLWRRLHVDGRRFVEAHIRWDIYADNMRYEFRRVTAADDGRLPRQDPGGKEPLHDPSG
jgi:glycosyltransferase involved in cell wall biosynthesis